MHGPIKVKSPNNISKWQMGFNSAYKRLNAELNPICYLLALLGAHPIFHFNRIRVKTTEARGQTTIHCAEFENECCCTSSAEGQLQMSAAVLLVLRESFK
jgi:hypothetical protein